ncbi:hypothetical protein AAG570_012367 [Ranatra chinensis]|uniref:Uncharacterized protein n=1 Tax=Ranatra chinensis TaxID=642074 RepID=A0ABD0YIL5_9HEMI
MGEHACGGRSLLELGQPLRCPADGAPERPACTPRHRTPTFPNTPRCRPAKPVPDSSASRASATPPPEDMDRRPVDPLPQALRISVEVSLNLSGLEDLGKCTAASLTSSRSTLRWMEVAMLISRGSAWTHVTAQGAVVMTTGDNRAVLQRPIAGVGSPSLNGEQNVLIEGTRDGLRIAASSYIMVWDPEVAHLGPGANIPIPDDLSKTLLAVSPSPSG